MKKTITLFAILTTLAFASADITSNLKYSQSGTQVTELQQFLVSKGFLNTTSGYFGQLTLKAVKSYQLSIDLPATGFVGAMTRAKINEKVVKEATSTPIVVAPVVQQAVQPVIQYVYVPIAQPVATVHTKVEEVKPEDVYYLDFTSIENMIGWNPHIGRDGMVGFTFTPRVTMNNNPIKVQSCFLTDQGRYTMRSTFNNKISYEYTSGDYVNRLTANEHGLVTCVLVNGKEVSN